MTKDDNNAILKFNDGTAFVITIMKKYKGRCYRCGYVTHFHTVRPLSEIDRCYNCGYSHIEFL